MKLSKRDASRLQGSGFFITPDNQIIPLQKNQSHLEWLRENQEVVRKYDSSLEDNDPRIFTKAFSKGWVRVRIEFDESDMSKLIASVSSVDIDLLNTIPEKMKELISSANVLEFIEMPTANVKFYNKEEINKMLRIQQLASYKPIRMVLRDVKS